MTYALRVLRQASPKASWTIVMTALVVAAFLPYGKVLAQAIDVSSEEYLNAATVVTAYDHFLESCDVGSLSAEDAAIIQNWETENLVPQFRAHLMATDPNQTGPVWNIRDELADEFESYGIRGCLGAFALISAPQADLFATAPTVMAALDSAQVSQPDTNPEAATQPDSNQQSGSAPQADGVALELREQIDSFAFDATYGFGVGGFMTVDVIPVVLFTTGDVLLKIEQLSAVDSIADGRAQNPEAWSKWRRRGDEIQIQRSAGWENLPFTATYSALPRGFQLNGRYRSLGGGGSIAFGGTTSVAAWTDYVFLEGGVVLRGGGASGSSEFGNTSVVVASLPPDQRGRYEINGLMLNMYFDNGASFSYVLVTDPGSDNSAIWLDGVAFTPR